LLENLSEKRKTNPILIKRNQATKRGYTLRRITPYTFAGINTLEEASHQLYEDFTHSGLLNSRSIFMTEIMDDSEISDTIHLRYNIGFMLDQPLTSPLSGLYRTKKHKHQKYAKFIHAGSHQSCLEFYQEIYAFWIFDVGLELADLASLEFYPNYDQEKQPIEILTEIYIPVL
ncbi:MAG: GyrI-like domain-containing protein, partial [Bacteroidota bacterium]